MLATWMTWKSGISLCACADGVKSSDFTGSGVSHIFDPGSEKTQSPAGVDKNVASLCAWYFLSTALCFIGCSYPTCYVELVMMVAAQCRSCWRLLSSWQDTEWCQAWAQFCCKMWGDTLVWMWNQYSHRVDAAEVKFYKYSFPILLLEVFWKQHWSRFTLSLQMI